MNTLEDIFDRLKLGNKEVLEIEFKYNSDCYIKFGKTIVLLVEFTNEELYNILKNIREKNNSNNYELIGKLIDSMEEVKIKIDEAIKITRHK